MERFKAGGYHGSATDSVTGGAVAVQHCGRHFCVAHQRGGLCDNFSCLPSVAAEHLLRLCGGAGHRCPRTADDRGDLRAGSDHHRAGLYLLRPGQRHGQYAGYRSPAISSPCSPGLPVRQVGQRWRNLVFHIDTGSPGGALCRVRFPPFAACEGHIEENG